MTTTTLRHGLALLALALLATPAPALAEHHEGEAENTAEAASSAGAATETRSTEERLDTLERAVGVLGNEQDRLRTLVAVPEDEELRSIYGLGPGASKIYLKERGLSIGGYGEWRGRFFVNDNFEEVQNELDQLRAILYTGYKFNDWIVLNSEIEFEHAATDKAGSVSVEFLTMDFLLDPAINVRAGLLLVPMGFINEIHEPVFFFGAARPEVERRIIPTTWRENGAGIFGELFDRLSYRFYVVNGFRAIGFDSSGFRSGRQKGSEALADHFAFVGRTDLRIIDGFTVGGSVYVGDSGQNETFTRTVATVPTTFNVPDARTLIWEAHTEFKRYGFSFRGLYVRSHLYEADILNVALGRAFNDGAAKQMEGGYAELAFDVLSLFEDCEMSLEPFYRFEHLDTQDKAASGFVRNRARDRDFHVVGLHFKPHPQVVIKLDYRNIDSEGGSVADEVQVGFGYVF